MQFQSLQNIFSIKYGALLLLVLQNTFLVVFMHYSRTRSEGPLYASSTAVTSMELVKFVSCILVVLYENKGSFPALTSAIYNEIIMKPEEIMKLSIPSILYSVQNNLLYYALSHLDAATYQVGYQLKILTTAIFSVLMLGRSLSWKQWGALVILTVGVALAQLSTSKNPQNEQRNTFLGFMAVILAACTSGFSGVYFEKILKGSQTSLWIRNIQMGIFSIISAVIGIYLSGESSQVLEKGFFYGYNSMVINVIMLQAVGGLIVAVVVKYADNILKGFAASFSIVTSCILSIFYFNFHPNTEFVLGALLVCFSTYVYSLPGDSGKKSDSPDNVQTSSSNPILSTRSIDKV